MKYYILIFTLLLFSCHSEHKENSPAQKSEPNGILDQSGGTPILEEHVNWYNEKRKKNDEHHITDSLPEKHDSILDTYDNYYVIVHTDSVKQE